MTLQTNGATGGKWHAAASHWLSLGSSNTDWGGSAARSLANA